MLECENYKMFNGTMKINVKNGNSFDVTGTWLYNPDYGMWYCKGQSYPEEICEVIENLVDEPNTMFDSHFAKIKEKMQPLNGIGVKGVITVVLRHSGKNFIAYCGSEGVKDIVEAKQELEFDIFKRWHELRKEG